MDLDAERPALGTHEFGSAPGYLVTHNGQKWLYLTAEQLDTVIGTGNKASKLKKELVAGGILKQFSAYLNRWDSQQARNEGVFAH
jgi:hypothetical protein